MNWRRLIDLLCRTPPGGLARFVLELLVRIAINAAVGAVAGAVVVLLGARVFAGAKLRYWRAYGVSFAGYAATYAITSGLIILLGSGGWVFGLGILAGLLAQVWLFRRMVGTAGGPRLSSGQATVMAAVHTGLGVLLYRIWFVWAFG